MTARFIVDEWPAPGHVNDAFLDLPGPLDLREQSERDLAVQTLAKLPTTGLLAAEIDTYSRLFPAEHWQLVTSSGHLEIPVTRGRPQPFPLTYLLRLTSQLKNLEECKGFGTLLGHLQNPSEFRSAAFEVQVASWCLSRPGTETIVFEKESSGGKHFDFSWHHDRGWLRCECKRGEIFDNDTLGKVKGIVQALQSDYLRLAPWPSAIRVDVALSGPHRPALLGRLTRGLEVVASQLALGGELLEYKQPDFSLTARRRETPYPVTAESWRFYGGELPVGPTELDYRNSQFTLTYQPDGYLKRATKALLHQARQQLPASDPGAVFLSLSGAAVQSEAERLLNLPSFAHLRFVALWGRDLPLGAVWRLCQPFDGPFLGLPTASDATSSV